MSSSARMRREEKTLLAMIRLYCRRQHGCRGALCDECENLRLYAERRLEACPYQEGKTTCARCPVHCYRPEMREKIREVMRYAGPRMVTRHPVLALYHLLDGRRGAPGPPRNRADERRRGPGEDPT